MEKAQAALPAVPLFQDLYLCTAGKSVCYPEHHFGPDVRRNYLIHYILSGYGSFVTEDNKQYRLGPGEGFLIEPGWRTCYRADREEPWTYIWVGFNGGRAAELVGLLGLGQKCPVFSCPASEKLEKMVEQLLLPASSNVLLSLNQHRFLLAFLQVLAENLDSKSEPEAGENRGNYHIDKALNFIRANYGNQIHVQDIAAYLGISRYHLSRLFKETMGCSVQEYVASFCLGQAREFLTTTEISVGEIALLCGYSNVEIFSKAFKKKYRTSPVQYRHFALEHPGVNPMEHG